MSKKRREYLESIGFICTDSKNGFETFELSSEAAKDPHSDKYRAGAFPGTPEHFEEMAQGAKKFLASEGFPTTRTVHLNSKNEPIDSPDPRSGLRRECSLDHFVMNIHRKSEHSLEGIAAQKVVAVDDFFMTEDPQQRVRLAYELGKLQVKSSVANSFRSGGRITPSETAATRREPLINYLVEQYPDKSANFIWQQLPRSEGDKRPIVLGRNRFEYWIDQEKERFHVNINSKEQTSIAKGTWEDHIQHVKREIDLNPPVNR